jgi:hypothetical protein
MNSEIEWNLNQGFALMLLKLMDEVNQASKESDAQWYEALRTLLRNVYGIKKMNKEAMKKINEKMTMIGKNFELLNNKSVTASGYNQSIVKNLKNDLHNINLELMGEINEADLVKFHIDRKDPGKGVLNG